VIGSVFTSIVSSFEADKLNGCLAIALDFAHCWNADINWKKTPRKLGGRFVTSFLS
jgi:hypothetical protein